MTWCGGRPEPAFEAPWHAQLFAITVALNEAGHFDWPDWAERFGATLKAHGLVKELDGGEDYFNAWLETLEGFLQDLGVAEAAVLRELKEGWTRAYLNTPHGAPVHLAAGEVAR
ncbi:nitrile hydratase accessory protein [Shimia sp. R10_1]|uniref:nitrile hydratase accessory protein n=1 Tax=Shimia sp. R10_1 TaxID=2821095 RepID=UPI001AD9D483|nr:nitrile hydratase accessory protein [Shimia sp. R10_1]MBO9473300.1 nitrile hydratase accessory protein [Shimia sp. R10_1]